MEGECKVGQAVSYWSDGVIALSRLPESSSCQQLTEWEDICAKKKKNSYLQWKTDKKLCRPFPACFLTGCREKQELFLLLNKITIVRFSLKLLWLSYNNIAAHLSVQKQRRGTHSKQLQGQESIWCYFCCTFSFKCYEYYSVNIISASKSHHWNKVYFSLCHVDHFALAFAETLSNAEMQSI